MKILFVSQHYWPEPLDSTGICEGLVERGHEVCALVGQPNYPGGKVYPGYQASWVTREEHNGVQIVRSPLHPRGTSVIDRVWNYYSFAGRATKVSRTLPDDFDVVLSYQTSPVLMVEPAIDYCRRTGAPLLLYCLDIWPECLTAGGIKAGSPIYEYFRRVSRGIYQEADLMAVSSPLFVQYLQDVVGVELDGAIDLPHFAPSGFLAPNVDPHPGFDRDKVNITFAGNVGSAQSPQTIVRAARLLADDQRIALHILGDGSELAGSQALANELGVTNLTFWGRHPLEDMPSFYAASDAMLITFSDERLLGYTLPLKTYTYLASGKPILGSLNGDVCRVIEDAQCGLSAPAEDAEGLARICRDFADLDVDERARLGANARAYYDNHYTAECFFQTLETALESLKGTRHGC